jgi:hypothetical protein
MVSVKHRENGRGPWTILGCLTTAAGALSSRGGLRTAGQASTARDRPEPSETRLSTRIEAGLSRRGFWAKVVAALRSSSGVDHRRGVAMSSRYLTIRTIGA